MIGSVIQAQFGKANDWPFGAALSLLTMLAIAAVLFATLGLSRMWRRRA
jgi:spermidine/putrescine transport system permease protein